MIRNLNCFFVVLVAFCLVTPTVSAQTVGNSSSDQSSPPRLREYDLKRKIFLRHSRSKSPEIHRAAIYNLCQLCWIISLDPRIKTHDRLRNMRAQIAQRLREWSRKNRPPAKKIVWNENGPESGDNPRDPGMDSINGTLPQTVNLPFREPSETPLDRELDAALISASSLMGDLTGGPRQLFRYHGGQFGAPWDHAPQLIAIIQATVTPDAWDVSGGTATIRYYQPALAMIIRAPQKTHDDICELLNKLRAAF